MTPALVIVTPAAVPVISVAEARAHLRVTETAKDTLIAGLISAIESWLAGPQGWLGRSLVKQTLELRLGCFPHPFDGIALPRPPFMATESVKYLDSSGTEQTLSTYAYETLPGGDGRAHLVLNPLQSWPATQARRNVVKIRYTAGYGETGETVDPGIRQAILMTVARLFGFRGDSAIAQLHGDPYIHRLFSPYVVWRC